MNQQKKKNSTRWITITLAGGLIVLLLAGAIYAQNGGSRRDRGGDQRGRDMGSGGGMGMGMEMGDRERERGEGMRGRIGMMAYMMEDPDIRKLTHQIRIISGINKLELTDDQVRTLMECARDAQSVVDSQLGSVRDEVKTTLQDQLNNVLAGGEFDQSALQALRDEDCGNVDEDAIHTAMQDTLQRVKDTLTKDQIQQLMEPGPMAERMRDRFNPGNEGENGQENGNGRQTWMDRPRVQNWLNNLNEEDRARIQDRIQERMGQAQERMADGKIMMFLLSPETIDSLQLWLDSR